MIQLIMTKGLPGSGKTTWAKAFVAGAGEPWLRVNKDELRERFSSEGEVVAARDTLIIEALSRNVSVVSDDTNLNPEHEIRLRELAAAAGADFLVLDFTNVPVEVCVTRDAQREYKARVGREVIYGMLKRYLKLSS